MRKFNKKRDQYREGLYKKGVAWNSLPTIPIECCTCNTSYWLP